VLERGRDDPVTLHLSTQRGTIGRVGGVPVRRVNTYRG
jgi:hypothetical protein